MVRDSLARSHVDKRTGKDVREVDHQTKSTRAESQHRPSDFGRLVKKTALCRRFVEINAEATEKRENWTQYRFQIVAFVTRVCTWPGHFRHLDQWSFRCRFAVFFQLL